MVLRHSSLTCFLTLRLSRMRPHHLPRAPWRWSGLWVVPAASLLGCGGDLVAPKPLPDPSRLYWALALDTHAVNLSTTVPYDTLRLAAHPRDAAGNALPDAGNVVVYTSSDVSTVQVTPSGVVRAIAPNTGITVVATLTIGNVTHGDTAFVNVTADQAPPTLARVSIHPVPPDSAKRAADSQMPYTWPVSATDPSGNPIPNLVFACTSSDSTIASVPSSCGYVLGLRPGRVRLTASTTAYGVAMADTLDFTVGRPLTVVAGLRAGMTALGSVTVATGGVVRFWDFTGRPVDITFADTTNVAEDPWCQCGSGNIPPFGITDPFNLADIRSRRFPVPGTYPYHSTALHASGTIIVRDDR
jgi:hypothetical protein